jgi:hypothetical protein
VDIHPDLSRILPTPALRMFTPAQTPLATGLAVPASVHSQDFLAEGRPAPDYGPADGMLFRLHTAHAVAERVRMVLANAPSAAIALHRPDPLHAQQALFGHARDGGHHASVVSPLQRLLHPSSTR